MLYLLRLILVVTLLPFSVSTADELESGVQQAMEQAREHAATMEVRINKHQDAGMKAAKESAEIFNSQEFQEKIQCEEKRIKKEVFAGDTEKPRQEEVFNHGKLAVNEKLYLFFSSSMPDETIHSYLAAVDELNEPAMTMLMRGFVPGERHRYLTRIAKKDRSCVDKMQRKNPELCERFKIPVKIQPSLFSKYEVTQVPALVYERQGEIWKITGIARLDYLLEQINREAKSLGLENLITTLQRGKDE